MIYTDNDIESGPAPFVVTVERTELITFRVMASSITEAEDLALGAEGDEIHSQTTYLGTVSIMREGDDA